MSKTGTKIETKRYFLQTLDPLHVGTGGSRLGRVDLSIVREPGTKLPKIPGTALHGAIRQYAAYCYDKLNCAGSGQGDSEHCKSEKCAICYTFGYLKGQDGGQSGVVSIGDARILLFPVYSMAGPVWVTCPAILKEFDIEASVSKEFVRLGADLDSHQHLNLGWLMLPREVGAFDLPDIVPAEIKPRTALVSDALFSHIVNSNLEVRTSVSIDPNTGAASDGALFTYEAIPRATVLWLDVICDDFKKAFPADDKHENPLALITSALKLAEMLGVGGMGTRGFGRVKMLEEKA